MPQEKVLDTLRILGRELEQALPHPSPEQAQRLTQLAACLAAEAGLLPPPPLPIESEMLDEAISLLLAVVNAKHPPREIDGPLGGMRP